MKVTVTAPAEPGRTVKREELAARIEAAIRERKHEVAVPIGRDEPAMTAANARDVRALIGTFTTYYVAGEPRVTNIQQIAKDVDGTVVAPGARFSLNETAGERTEAKGYVEAPFIADGKIEPSIGGGVSQLSTTLYNAAFFAGLQLDGHRPHSFFIDRYPAGREATLNYPDIDLAWTNDTDAPVLIRTKTDAGAVTVRLYGDNGGRRVKRRVRRARAADRRRLRDHRHAGRALRRRRREAPAVHDALRQAAAAGAPARARACARRGVGLRRPRARHLVVGADIAAEQAIPRGAMVGASSRPQG